MNAPLTGAPRLIGALPAIFMAYAAVWAVLRLVLTGSSIASLLGLLLMAAGFITAASGPGLISAGRAVLSSMLTMSGFASVVLSVRSVGIADAWLVVGLASVVLVLLRRGRRITGWSTMLAAFVIVGCLGGWALLQSLGLLSGTLILAVLVAAGRTLTWYASQMEAYTKTEREAMEWRVAQDAYQVGHQQRIEQTARMAKEMLEQISVHGRLDEAGRVECGLLHQAIRDETRGRLLLNDAVRAQVLLHRRRGASVQLLDDGDLSSIDPVELSQLLDKVAEQIAQLESDRIVIRSGAADATAAITVVATTSDPVAAALGQDEDEEIDLWLELPRPALPRSAHSSRQRLRSSSRLFDRPRRTSKDPADAAAVARRAPYVPTVTG